MTDPAVQAAPGRFTFEAPTKVVHGAGALAALGPEVAARGAHRPLVVTDPGIAASGILAKVVASLEAAGLVVAVFDRVTHTASVAAVEAGDTAGRAHGYDAVIGVGGGSSLAASRGVAVLGAMGGTVAGCLGKELRTLPLFSVPTTAGSGSEVSPSAPLVDHARGAKITLSGPGCFSRVAILDPELLASLPPRQAALSGVDALTHALEAMLTSLATPITDALALGAMRILASDLPRVVRGGEPAATGRCLVASTMANQACGNAKLGLVHGLARNVQTLFAVTYGETIGVLLVPVLAFDLGAPPPTLPLIAGALGVAASGSSETTAADVVARVKRLLVEIGIPRHFDPAVVDRARIPLMARMVYARNTPAALDPAALERVDVSGWAPSPNLRRATYDDLVRLYERSLDGWQLD